MNPRGLRVLLFTWSYRVTRRHGVHCRCKEERRPSQVFAHQCSEPSRSKWPERGDSHAHPQVRWPTHTVEYYWAWERRESTGVVAVHVLPCGTWVVRQTGSGVRLAGPQAGRCCSVCSGHGAPVPGEGKSWGAGGAQWCEHSSAARLDAWKWLQQQMLCRSDHGESFLV